jgi:hypothetical protein
MKILQVHIGRKKQVSIHYEEGTDSNYLKLEEPGRPQLYEAFGLLGQAYVIALAEELGENPEAMLKKLEFHINDVSFTYDEGEVVPSTYSFKGHEFLNRTIHDSPVNVRGLKFGNLKGPDGSIKNILEEAEKYINGERAMVGLFDREGE